MAWVWSQTLVEKKGKKTKSELELVGTCQWTVSWYMFVDKRLARVTRFTGKCVIVRHGARIFGGIMSADRRLETFQQTKVWDIRPDRRLGAISRHKVGDTSATRRSGTFQHTEDWGHFSGKRLGAGGGEPFDNTLKRAGG